MNMKHSSSDTSDTDRELDDVDLAVLSGQQHGASKMIMESLGAEPVEATQGKRRQGRPAGRNFKATTYSFDIDTLDRLDEMASAAGLSKSAILRQLVNEAHEARDSRASHSAKLDKILDKLGVKH